MNNKDYIKSKIIFRKVDNYYFKLDDYTKNIFSTYINFIKNGKFLFLK